MHVSRLVDTCGGIVWVGYGGDGRRGDRTWPRRLTTAAGLSTHVRRWCMADASASDHGGTPVVPRCSNSCCLAWRRARAWRRNALSGVGPKDMVGGKNVWRSAHPAAYGSGVVESKAKRRAMGATAVGHEGRRVPAFIGVCKHHCKLWRIHAERERNGKLWSLIGKLKVVTAGH
jgi:hypothetical protein